MKKYDHNNLKNLTGTPSHSTHAAAPVNHCVPLGACPKNPLPLPEHCKTVTIFLDPNFF